MVAELLAVPSRSLVLIGDNAEVRVDTVTCRFAVGRYVPDRALEW